MSNKIVKSVLANGTKSLIVHYYFESDGVEGEIKDSIIIDTQGPPESLNTNYDVFPYTPNILLRLSQAWWSFSWFDGLLSYADVGTNSPFWVLARDNSNYMDFRYIDGLGDRVVSGIAQQDQPWTKVAFSTNGFAPAGSVGSLILEFRKTTIDVIGNS